jgi:putative transposase
MTMREIQGFLAEQYGVDVSPEFISSVADAVMVEARQSQRCRSLVTIDFYIAIATNSGRDF